ncbi:MAG: hypothetical protein RIB84_07630 [Sneathiellaceae bacterium]
MTTLYAQPYDITATGFYFETAEQYAAQAAKAVNDYGQRVEEFEIQFIDGENPDAALAEAWGLNQVNLAAFLTAADEGPHRGHRPRWSACPLCASGLEASANCTDGDGLINPARLRQIPCFPETTHSL